MKSQTIRNISAYLMLIVTIVLSSSLFATSFHIPYSASYSVKASSLNLGKLIVTLEINNNKYVYKKKTAASGLMKMIRNDIITEISEGVISNKGIPQPLKYNFLHTNKKKTRSENTLFKKHDITGTWNKSPYQYHTKEPFQDPASQDLALTTSLSNNMTEIDINMIKKGVKRSTAYIYRGKEKKRVPAGIFETIHLIIKRENSKRSTDIWVAPSLNYIPVKIIHKDKPEKPEIITVLESTEGL